MTLSDFKICARCGKLKQGPRYNTSALCLECDAETTCAHYDRPGGLISDDWRCAAGVCLLEIAGPREGWMRRIPCRWIKDGEPVKCDKFQAQGTEKAREWDDAVEESNRRLDLTLPIINQIKKVHRGRDWSGVVDCPVCRQGQKLSLSHSGYNGHVWGRCETQGCMSWME